MLYIFPTIDVEGVHGSHPFEQMALGRIGEKEDWGALKIARILDKYNIAGTFFVDVYESFLFGEEPVGKLCQDLIALNQDVQLHTHPSWRDDPRDSKKNRELKRASSHWPQSKDFMYKNSLNQQIEILEWGCDFLERWIGTRPIAHRAGGYGVNIDTFKALAQVGIRLDSSMLFLHPNSKIILSMNKISKFEGIIEIPITGFQRIEYLTIFGVKLLKRHFPFYKTSLNSNYEDLMWFVNQKNASGCRMMNFFMHSYSLLNFDKKFRKFQVDKNKLLLLENFLKNVRSTNNVVFNSMNQFQNALRYNRLPQWADDHIDIRTIQTNIFFKVLQKYFCPMLNN